MSSEQRTDERPGPGRILIIDDTPANLRLLMQILTTQGYIVHPAANGSLALRFVQFTLPDLVLLDIFMPDMDGYEVCARLKASERTRDIPVIFISSADQVLDKVKAFSAGGVDYIAKPFQAEEVLARVTTHLALRNLQKRLEERVQERTAELLQANTKLNDEIARRQLAEEETRALNAELEQRVAERTAELAAINQELEAFTYSVSHDLRAPLRVIEGFSRFLLEEYAAQIDSQVQPYLQRVRENAQYMSQLIEDLLSFSHLSRQPLRKNTVVMADLVQQVWEELRPDYEKRRFELHLGELPDCQADPALLKQVWVNLLGNALKYTRPREAAQIEIGTQAVDERPAYFVKDNGVGFEMRYAHKLFGVFQRLHSANEFEGTGVGLAIVQRIIHRHGGRVWAEGAVGQGATFYFTLPEPAAVESDRPAEEVDRS